MTIYALNPNLASVRTTGKTHGRHLFHAALVCLSHYIDEGLFAIWGSGAFR